MLLRYIPTFIYFFVSSGVLDEADRAPIQQDRFSRFIAALDQGNVTPIKLEEKGRITSEAELIAEGVA